MTVAEMASDIGKKAFYNIHGLDISVEIQDAKEGYGRLSYKVTPLDGRGVTWVDRTKLTFWLDSKRPE